MMLVHDNVDNAGQQKQRDGLKSKMVSFWHQWLDVIKGSFIFSKVLLVFIALFVFLLPVINKVRKKLRVKRS